MKKGKLNQKTIQKARDKEMRTRDGHYANNLEKEGWVRDRKTGEWYHPDEKMRELLGQPWFLAQMRRMKER
jgi:hypothetical protein